MQYGLLPKDLVTDGQLFINNLSDADDFPDGDRVDSSTSPANWDSRDCDFVRDMPIYNVVAGRDDTGSVFKLREAAFTGALPSALRRPSRIRAWAALAAIGVSSVIAAILLRRNRK